MRCHASLSKQIGKWSAANDRQVMKVDAQVSIMMSIFVGKTCICDVLDISRQDSTCTWNLLLNIIHKKYEIIFGFERKVSLVKIQSAEIYFFLINF